MRTIQKCNQCNPIQPMQQIQLYYYSMNIEPIIVKTNGFKICTCMDITWKNTNICKPIYILFDNIKFIGPLTINQHYKSFKVGVFLPEKSQQFNVYEFKIENDCEEKYKLIITNYTESRKRDYLVGTGKTVSPIHKNFNDKFIVIMQKHK